MCLEEYTRRFASLRVNTAHGVTSPHKPCLLLAVLDLAEAGSLESNRIYFRPALLERYRTYFDCVRTANDRPNPYLPFFHLQGDGFWKLAPRDGREAVLAAMSTAHSSREIEENVAYASLDPPLYDLVRDPAARDALRASLITRWFGAHSRALHALIRKEQQVNREERDLREQVEGRTHETRDAVNAPARSAAFRRLVLEAYDYRCAATGWRLHLPGVVTLIDAAHLIPFGESGNDDPRNGIALTPTLHRALDSFLIAPGPDMTWHVAPILDDRISDHRPLLELRGRDVLYQGDPRYRPSQASLEWRASRLAEA